MSIGKVDKTIGAGEGFEGLTPEQMKQLMIDRFHEAYGRYENVSGSMYIELCHADAEENGAGHVHWVKGETDLTPEEDIILSREDAIPRLMGLMQRGYKRVTEGVTQDDIDRANAIRIATKSALDREGLLGTYRKGEEWLRVKEYAKGLYSVETGYGDALSTAEHELTETSARVEIDYALQGGYKKEKRGAVSGPKNNSGLLVFFGEAPPEVEEEREQKRVLSFFGKTDDDEEEEDEGGGFNPNWLNGLKSA